MVRRKRKRSAATQAECRSGNVRNTAEQVLPEAIKGLLVNPIYTGLGPFPRLVQDAAWVRGCARMIEEEGAEQVLVNLLYVLRECMGDGSAQD